MEMRTLAGSHLTVSALSMGTANFGTGISQEQAFAHMDRYVELGGNFLDTAHAYSDWIPGEKHRSEKIIGRWFTSRRPDSVVLCTKGGHYNFDAPQISRVTPEELRRDLEESLDCLQTDCIDLYMLHRDHPTLPVDEIMDCLDEFVCSGHVRYLACSNWTAQRTAQANAYARAHGKSPFIVNELMWSMAAINRAGIPDDYIVMDEDMLRLGRDSNMSFMCYSALAHGYFTRRYAGLPLADSLHQTYDNPHNEQLFAQLRSLPDRAAVTRESLRYFARQEVTAIPIVSFSSMEQLEECMRAFA
ncbi:MAG: aldo/keto reductase [Clostridia bacterium]|nr:aldo/keto reductase [Clostridia bacterium]